MIRQRGPTYWVVELYDSELKRKFQVRPADYGVDTPASEEEAKNLEFLAKRAGSSQQPPMTVRRYYELYCGREFNHSGHGITAQTNRYNRGQIKPFVERYGDYALGEVTVREASEFAMDPDTRRHGRAVKAMFANAVRDGLITDDPFASLSFQRNRAKPKAFLRQHDVEALAEAALIVHGQWGPMFRAWILWCAWTGMRPQEAAGSQWEFYDEAEQLYDVQWQWHGKDRKLLAPKHDSTGLVHVFEPAAQAVAGFERTGEFMFTNTRGTPMDSSTITHAFKAVKHIAGLPEATPGALRHFLASYMLNELSLPPYTIAQQLRHRDGGRLVVQTYGHPDRSMHLSRIAQAEAMGRVVGRPDDPEVAV